jgi:hypothetical protein
MARLVLEDAAADAGANAEELQAAEARRRNESANFMVMPKKVLGFRERRCVTVPTQKDFPKTMVP